MKGPYERLKYALQRVWECPICNHRERTDGSVTLQFCRCQSELPLTQHACMRLVKDGIRRPSGRNSEL